MSENKETVKQVEKEQQSLFVDFLRETTGKGALPRWEQSVINKLTSYGEKISVFENPDAFPSLLAEFNEDPIGPASSLHNVGPDICRHERATEARYQGTKILDF